MKTYSKPKKRNKRIEHQHQSAYIQWCEFNINTYPELGNIFSIPNGAWYGTDTELNIRMAAKMKREGLRKGVPDLFLAYPSNKYHGMFIEFKKDASQKLKPEQAEWIKKLSAVKYVCAIVYTLDDAIQVTLRYLQKGLYAPKEQKKVG